MITKKACTVVMDSVWTKGNKCCRVISERDIINSCLNKISKISFTGDNPFPCYQMTSTFNVLAAWMIDNGWKREPGMRTTIYYEVIDSNTGKTITTCKNVTNIICTRETRKLLG